MANRNPQREAFFQESGVVCANAEQTASAGRLWAAWLESGSVLSLEGPLGAGKTCFVRGLAHGLGHAPSGVSSPTFTLVHEYTGGAIPLLHYDLYRIESVEELEPLGIADDLGATCICAVEWGDKFPQIFPPRTIRIQFTIEGSRRILRALNHSPATSPR
ncbi:MAG: tRNA (adenosine(37)-N6)-threonylcarbamoyltransferase complex ATPase subunit type 1 TsaE [Terrimicrobiaceae bacterium]|nr:tRNA (adenosine(37)-N6)-threonylcarbamoyltransferase complex ATPase subunit type 1 TsaE [Terrimicrobiaceae bacterium]